MFIFSLLIQLQMKKLAFMLRSFLLNLVKAFHDLIAFIVILKFFQIFPRFRASAENNRLFTARIDRRTPCSAMVDYQLSTVQAMALFDHIL